jgi:hypothetical protein
MWARGGEGGSQRRLRQRRRRPRHAPCSRWPPSRHGGIGVAATSKTSVASGSPRASPTLWTSTTSRPPWSVTRSPTASTTSPQREALPRTREIFIIADAGGSDSYPVAHVGSADCNASQTSSTCRTTSAAFCPAPASGTRSSTASFSSSRSTGAGDLCGPTRHSSISSATRPTEAASSCAPGLIVAAIRPAGRSRR